MEPVNRFEPMNDDEKAHMWFIYNTRLRFWLISFIGLMCLVVGLCYRGNMPRHLDEKGRDVKEKKWDGLTIAQMQFTSFSFIALPIVAVMFFTYRRRLLPYKKDAKRGEKELIAYQIIRKQYFEHTGQYFVSFDNPNYMHHEVDAAFYFHCSPGDYAYMYRAPLSKYVFDKSGRFTLL